ncbi:MAG: hypothetical protein WAV32_04745 [Halobacteriota archaeon]
MKSYHETVFSRGVPVTMIEARAIDTKQAQEMAESRRETVGNRVNLKIGKNEKPVVHWLIFMLC